jgi:DNA repair exonuclease SbcCD ATPase subunit
MRYPSSLRPALFCFALLVGGENVFAQRDPRLEKLTPEQVKSELKQVEAEIDRLTKSSDAPDAWKDLLKAEADLRELSKAYGTLRTRLDELQARDDIRSWREKIEKLRDQHYDLEWYDARYTRLAGKKIWHGSLNRRHLNSNGSA